MGLMRTLRKMIYRRDGTRINAVCPGMTDTKYVAPMLYIWAWFHLLSILRVMFDKVPSPLRGPVDLNSDIRKNCY
jgi:NAD(P)-dependent dehydrogenase (short-subunit alcohol dehydrogenase family)